MRALERMARSFCGALRVSNTRQRLTLLQRVKISWLCAVLLGSSATLNAQDEAQKFELETSANQGIKAYTHPGVVSYKAGRWIGNDNLFNLAADIRLIVEIIKPEGLTFPITADALREKAEAQVKAQGINPVPAGGDITKNILPFIHVQILVYPIEGGFAIGIDARLFEMATLPRVQMEAGAMWQAITWEKQTLIVTPAAGAAESVQTTVTSMLDAFVKRYKFYEKLKTYVK